MLTGCPTAGIRGRRRSGMVLVAVLLTAAVLLSAAMGLAWFSRNQIRRLEADRSELQSRSVAFLAVQQVMRGLVLDTNDYDSPGEKWFGSHIVPIPDVGVAFVDIRPLDDRLPMAGLFLPDRQTLRKELEGPWQRLWDLLGHPELEQVLLDFMDQGSTPRLGGMEREDFPNRPPADLEALRYCPGFDPVLLTGDIAIPDSPRLKDYLSPWVKDKINVNVATPQTLLVLDELMDAGVVDSLLEQRETGPLRSMEDLESVPGFPASAVPRLTSILGFKSTYFGVAVQVQLLSG